MTAAAGTLAGTTTQLAGNLGTAVFDGLSINSAQTADTFAVTSSASTAITSQNFAVTVASQTITFAQPLAQSFGTTPTLTATLSSALTVSFTSSTTSVCTITSGGVLTFLTSGTCTIAADQAGNSSYSAATTVSRSFAVNAVVPGAPTIGNATSAGSQQATVSFTAPASTGGAAITGYTVASSPGNFTASGTASPITVTGLTNGTVYTFTVSASNTTGVGLASSASNGVTPSGAQTITFANPGTQSFSTNPTLIATASSGLNVSWGSQTPAVCLISSTGTLTFSTVGTCTVSAYQAGDATYTAATAVAQSFIVQKGTPTITTLPTASGITYGQTLASSTLGGGTISPAGTYTWTTITTAPNAGTATYEATFTPTDITNWNTAVVNVSVTTVLAAQTITFTQPATPIVYGSTLSVPLSATGGGSTNPVTFTVASGPGTITGTTLTITGAGTVVVNANQLSSSNYTTATRVQRSIVVSTSTSTLTGPTTQPVFVVYNQAGTVPVTVAGQYRGIGITAPSGTINYFITDSGNFLKARGPLTIVNGAVSVPVASTLAPGLYTVTVLYSGDSNYSAAPQLTLGLQVGQIQPMMVWAQPTAISYGTTLATVLNAVAQDESGTPAKAVPGSYVYSTSGYRGAYDGAVSRYLHTDG